MKFRKTVIKIWKDPVWSFIIASGIILLITTIWAKLNHYSYIDIYNFSIRILSLKLPIYFFIVLIGFFLLLRLIIKLFRNRKDPIWDEQIGNYKFGELYSILKGQNFPVRTVGMNYSGRQPPEDNLLTLFRAYSTFLNKGIDIDDHIDDGGYLYGVLAPKLVGYGIVKKVESKNLQIDVIDIKYETSELGHKFFALLEKVIHLKKK